MTLSIVLAFGLASAAPTGAQTVDGAKLFATRCATCHWDPNKPGEQPRLGPSLKGVVGRTAGTHAAYTRYSKAMKAHGQRWTEASLDTYLENPRKTVPGTNMVYPGLKKPEERAAVIAYLKRASSPR